ncbi:MAG: GNAT family N-acetyltransferase [Clostridia bacterium]|nr:GNAT family N-acetyltransferase [Clostridia bacterium]
MKDCTVAPYVCVDAEELKTLYKSVGWTSYLRRPDLLKEAYAHSLKALAAYDGERLIGIIRAVGDGVSILYIQDLLIHPAYQRRGLGTRLMTEMLRCFPDVNQAVLLTDETEETVQFYEAAGFQKVQKVGCCAFIRLHECYG